MEGTWSKTDLTSASSTLFEWLRTPRNRETGAVGCRSKKRNLLLKIAQNVLKIVRCDLKIEMSFVE